MHRQLKQTALPCRLSSEHFRHHYLALCHQRPRADVEGRVDVCVRGVTARDAEEGGLIGSVLLVDATARGALARRVAWIDEDHGDASALRLVDTKPPSWAKPQLPNRARWLPPLAVTRLRMPLSSSRAIPRPVRSASNTTALAMQWFVCFWNLACFPASLRSRRLAAFVPRFCKPDRRFCCGDGHVQRPRRYSSCRRCRRRVDDAEIDAKPILGVNSSVSGMSQVAASIHLPRTKHRSTSPLRKAISRAGARPSRSGSPCGLRASRC